MAGVVIDRVSHALLEYHLRNATPSRAIATLPSILEMTAAAQFEGLRHGFGSVRIATHRTLRASNFKLVDFNRDAIGPLDMPRLAAGLRRDADGDIVLDMRELELSPKARLWRRTPKEAFSILLAGRLPDTLADGLAGRDLSDVISHPALNAMSLRIKGIRDIDEYEASALVLPDKEPPLSVIEMEPFGKTIINDRD